MFTRRHLLALAATPLLGQDESGFHALFDGRTLQGWEVKEGPESAFAVEEGAILVTEAANSPTWLATTKTYENFDLRLEFFVKGWIDSGIYLRAPEHGPAIDCGLCIKIFHKEENPPKPESMGSVFPHVAPRLVNVKSKGEWNSMRILLEGSRLQVWTNGAMVQDLNLSEHPDLRYRLTSGRIGLQSLSYPIRFRNLRVKELPGAIAWQSLYREPADFEKNWFVEEGKAKWLPLGPIFRTDYNGHLATKVKYKDFVLETYVRARKHSNGGIFFRSEGSGQKPHYEIQIHDVEGAVYPTGSLYGIQRAKYPRLVPEQWFLFQVFVKGPHCVIRINGENVVDYAKLDRLEAGHVLLQAHQSASWIEYKQLRIREI
ncbi:MAG: DUF1080 domain-containing protein [Acidobacteria bacterium]|jgi:hypothetical protein|nr:DUF1080 domain-containing protein [Acidobacteriota bacterium]